MLAPDERPLLVCRLECPPRMQADVDAWMPKHFDDSLMDPIVTSAHSFRVLRDFRPVSAGGLPAAFNGHGNRFIVYVYANVEGIIPFIDGPDVRGAIRDGEEREGQYPPLDEERFNGVVYTVRRVIRPCGADLAGAGPILVQRFEVDDAEAPAFDAWLDGVALTEGAALPGVVRARTFSAYREMPRRFPHDRYLGKGNRMILLDLAEGTDAAALLRSDAGRAWLAAAAPWDLRLPYVRREAGELLTSRTRAEALEARNG